MSRCLEKTKNRVRAIVTSLLTWRVVFASLFLCVSQSAFADFALKDKVDKVTNFLLSPWGDNSPWILIAGIISLGIGVRYYKAGKWGRGTFFVAVAVGTMYAPDLIYSWMPDRMQPGVDKIINLSSTASAPAAGGG